MIIGTIILTIHVPWVRSLKEKRAIVKSLCAKTSNKFNVSIAEIDQQDTHGQIVLGIACVANQVSYADSILDKILNFIETNTEGEVMNVNREII